MTRKEAIEVLKDLWRYEHSEFSEKDIREALDIAINSVEIDERYELEHENAEEIHREKEQAYMQGYEDACKKYRQETKAVKVMKMRDATPEERKSIYKYIKSISKPTGVAFWDLEQEPKTGRWVKISPADIYECSECGQNVMTAHICVYKYCHGCGAKMEGGQNGN